MDIPRCFKIRKNIWNILWKHTSSMFPLISSVLPAKKRKIAPWTEERKKDCSVLHANRLCVKFSSICSADLLYSNYSWLCLTKTFQFCFRTHCVTALSLFSGMGRHVVKRWSGNRDCEFTRMWVRWSGRSDSMKRWLSACKMQERWCTIRIQGAEGTAWAEGGVSIRWK